MVNLCQLSKVPTGFLDLGSLPSPPWGALSACCLLDLIPKCLQDYCCKGMDQSIDFCDGSCGIVSRAMLTSANIIFDGTHESPGPLTSDVDHFNVVAGTFIVLML